MKVKVEFEVTVEWNDTGMSPAVPGGLLEHRIEKSVAEAIDNVIDIGLGDGFRHDMEDLVCLGITGKIKATMVR